MWKSKINYVIQPKSSIVNFQKSKLFFKERSRIILENWHMMRTIIIFQFTKNNASESNKPNPYFFSGCSVIKLPENSMHVNLWISRKDTHVFLNNLFRKTKPTFVFIILFVFYYKGPQFMAVKSLNLQNNNVTDCFEPQILGLCSSLYLFIFLNSCFPLMKERPLSLSFLCPKSVRLS